MQNENTRGITGLCLSPVDLAISKLAAGREKDLSFVKGMLLHGLISSGAIESVLAELAEPKLPPIRTRLARCRTDVAE